MTDEIYYEEIPSTDPRLGRNILHDERSRAFAFNAAGITPVSVRHPHFIDILDQGNLGSCTGNSGIGCLGTFPFYPTVVSKINDWSEAAAIQLYSDATAIDPFSGTYPPEDTGSNGLSIAKVLVKRGLISGYQHTFSFDAMLAALTTRPVITGVNWYSSFYYPDNDGIVNFSEDARVEGGHEFILDEIDMERQLIGATNSWGTSFGKNGRFYLPFSVMRRLLAEKGDITVFTPLTAPAPTPIVNPVVPSPLPTPNPVATDADSDLWLAVKTWATKPQAGTSKKIADALKKWHLTKQQ